MRFAQIISVLCHPLFMPVYAVALIFQFNPYISFQVPELLKTIVFGILAIFTIFLPIITALIMKKLGIVQSIYMKTAAERRWPFLFTAVWYFLCFKLLTTLSLPKGLYLLMIGAITVILIAHLITFRWKISVHMIGISGVLGAVVGLSHRFHFDHLLLVLLLIGVAGLVGYSRLKTESHTPMQVYAGFILGFLIEWLAVSFF